MKMRCACVCRFLVVDCNTINNCDLNAECRYDLTTGNYQCQCVPGYSGDGFSCRVTGTATPELHLVYSKEEDLV